MAILFTVGIKRTDVSKSVRNALIALFSLAGVASASPAGAQGFQPVPVYQGCAAAAPMSGRTFYVDPAAQNGNGSRQQPFAKISDALGIASGGDSILLKSGSYGDVAITGSNKDFITIAAQEGQKPVLSKLTIGTGRPASHWRFTGLTITGFDKGGLQANGWAWHAALAIMAASDNIIFDRNIVATTLEEYKWMPDVRGVASPNSPSSGLFVNNSSCVSIVGNHFSNVFNGIMVGR